MLRVDRIIKARCMMFTRKKKSKPKMEEDSSSSSIDIKISAVAGALWFIIFTISMLLIALFDYLDVGEEWIVVEMVVLNLLALYVLFAIKIADEWEKAVILRFGRFVGLRDRGCSGYYRSSTRSRSGSIIALW